MSVRRIGVLTSGGDCPGLNAVIRAVTKVAVREHGLEVIGIRDGFHGLMGAGRSLALGPDQVRGLLPRGGTILGTASRGNPFAWQDAGGGPVRDRSREVLAGAEALGLDAVVVIGGEGSLKIGLDLHRLGLPVVGVPKTIDNDIALTDRSFGFDSAVATASDAVDKLHTTAESHHRVMVVEVMGRHVGWIAVAAGIGGGGDVILIPEIPYRREAVAARVEERASQGSAFSIVVVAEGAKPVGGDETWADARAGRLGGVGDRVGSELAAITGREVRTTVLGHIQRGGSPTAFDRILATRFGAGAARLAARGGFGRMVALAGDAIGDVAIADAVQDLKRVPPGGELVTTARGVGISFGDS